MKVEFVNPFVTAACDVLRTETNTDPKKGAITVLESPLLSDEVTVLIGVTGSVRGVVMYGMSEQTAKRIVGTMIGEPVAVFDDMAGSAISEMGNVVTGRAGIKMDAAGYPCTIAPPTLIVGKDTIISTMEIKRLVIPLSTEIGDVTMHIALQESTPS